MFVVDGYNAIRRVPRFAVVEARDGLRAGRDALVTAILGSGTLRAQPVVIIFDGSEDIDVGHNFRAPHPKLTLRFSRSPDNADQEILRFLGTGSAATATVITADQDLAFESRRLGATVVAPESWNVLKLPKCPKRKSHEAPSEKPNASASDVAYWRDVFEDES